MQSLRIVKLEYDVFSRGGIAHFINGRIQKNTATMHASWSFYHYILKSILLIAYNLNVQEKIIFSAYITRVMFI